MLQPTPASLPRLAWTFYCVFSEDVEYFLGGAVGPGIGMWERGEGAWLLVPAPLRWNKEPDASAVGQI